MEFYRLSEDLPEQDLIRGEVGYWDGTYLEDTPMVYRMTFRWAGRYKMCWVQRQKLYSVEQPFDWFGKPNITKDAQIMLSSHRGVIWKHRGHFVRSCRVYEHLTYSSKERLVRLVNGRLSYIQIMFGQLVHIYEV